MIKSRQQTIDSGDPGDGVTVVTQVVLTDGEMNALKRAGYKVGERYNLAMELSQDTMSRLFELAECYYPHPAAHAGASYVSPPSILIKKNQATISQKYGKDV